MNRTYFIGAAVFAASVCLGCSSMRTEHADAKTIEIMNIDFGILKDGTYRGRYDGGLYGWRENECAVTVSGNKVIGITLVESKEDRPADFFQELYGRVIKAQSLRVDAISGATLTSKAHLKAVEAALLKAQE